MHNNHVLVIYDRFVQILHNLHVLRFVSADVLLKQLEEGSWTLTDEGLKEKVRKLKKADQASEEKAQRQQQQQQREQQSIQPTGSSSTPSTGRRPGLRNRSYTEHRQRDIAVFDECLGYGRSGIVLVGRWDSPVCLINVARHWIVNMHRSLTEQD